MGHSRAFNIRSPLLALAVIAACVGRAGATINLSATDCQGSYEATWTCISNSGYAVTMVASLSAADTLRPVGQESILEISFAEPVPQWWYIGDGLCRPATSLEVGHVAAPSCVDYFGRFTGGVSASHEYLIGPLQPGADRGGDLQANEVRLIVRASVDSTQVDAVAPVAPGNEIFLFSVKVDRRRTRGADACSGCTSPACACLRDVRLLQRSPASEHHESVVPGSWMLMLEGGTVNCIVATRPTTWGQVKSLYR